VQANSLGYSKRILEEANMLSTQKVKQVWSDFLTNVFNFVAIIAVLATLYGLLSYIGWYAQHNP
jgi:hypothetical protein